MFEKVLRLNKSFLKKFYRAPDLRLGFFSPPLSGPFTNYSTYTTHTDNRYNSQICSVNHWRASIFPFLNFLLIIITLTECVLQNKDLLAYMPHLFLHVGLQLRKQWRASHGTKTKKWGKAAGATFTSKFPFEHHWVTHLKEEPFFFFFFFS